MSDSPLNNNAVSSGKKMGIAILAVLFVVGVYVVWDGYLSPAAKRERENARNIDSLLGATQRFEDALKTDTYGGQTPQETLNLFIAALKEGNIDLASKYFHIETNENDPNFMTVNGWKGWLVSVQERGLLNQMIEDIERDFKPVKGTDNGDFAFIAEDAGMVKGVIDMMLNSRSNVWKIESM